MHYDAKGAAEPLLATPTACCCSMGAQKQSVRLVQLPLRLLAVDGQAPFQWCPPCMGSPVYARTNSRRLSSVCRCTGPSALLWFSSCWEKRGDTAGRSDVGLLSF